VRKHHPAKPASRRTHSASLQSVEEEPPTSMETPLTEPSHPLEDSGGAPDMAFDINDTCLDDMDKRSHRVRTAKSGNPLITMVHKSGVFDMEVLFCICPNAGMIDEQLLQTGLFPSSLKQIETVFTFSVLNDFLLDNLECKTTAQQYYSKLQCITNQMFPHHVPVCHHTLLMICAMH